MKKCIIIFFWAILIYGCQKPEIKLICNKSNNEGFDEVYLIKNLPNDSNEVRKLLVVFNRDLDTMNRYGSRCFVKQHEQGWFDNLDYERDSCSDIDIMDIVLELNKYKQFDGSDTVWYNWMLDVVE